MINDGLTSGSFINNGTANLSGAYSILLDQASMNFTNNGTINATANYVLWLNGASIGTFLNAGTIDGSTVGYTLRFTTGSISTFTNSGSISGVFSSIMLDGGLTIGTLNNEQGASSSALKFSASGRSLPTNYNIIINSASDYGKLNWDSPSGSTTFGIYTSSSVAAGTYTSVLTGLTSSNLAATSGSYNGFNWTLLNSSGTTWDLVFSLAGPSAADTQASINTQARRLRSTFNSTMASGNFANMNAYDCNLFDKNNMCISAGGRVTTIDNPSSHHSAAVVVLGHKISPHIRIGGFLDQSVNHNMPSGVDMSNKNPMMGAFAVWNHQSDGLGFQMKLANAYLDKDVTTSRAVVGTSEAGRGRTDLNTQSYVGELSYAFTYQDQTLVRPYFALRYTRIKQDGYTEDTTAAVTSPLTYAKLSDRSTSALMGVKVNHTLTPKTNLTASLGVEQDLDHKSDQLVATGVSGLTSENFNNNIRHTRPVASLGAYYAVAKNQRLSGDIYYQQLPFQSTDSATAYVNYMIGF
ncbi:Autotransporter beta-domain containing protein [Candidatus Methylopumilus universalis]